MMEEDRLSSDDLKDRVRYLDRSRFGVCHHILQLILFAQNWALLRTGQSNRNIAIKVMLMEREF